MKGPVVNALSQIHFPPIPRAGNRAYTQMGNAKPYLSWESKAQPLGECGTPPNRGIKGPTIWGTGSTPNRVYAQPPTRGTGSAPANRVYGEQRLAANPLRRAPRLPTHPVYRHTPSPVGPVRRAPRGTQAGTGLASCNLHATTAGTRLASCKGCATMRRLLSGPMEQGPTPEARPAGPAIGGGYRRGQGDSCRLPRAVGWRRNPPSPFGELRPCASRARANDTGRAGSANPPPHSGNCGRGQTVVRARSFIPPSGPCGTSPLGEL